MDKSCTIQDVFERFYPSYEKRSNPPAHHRKTAYHIRNCKTGVFGVNISVCEDCGCISVHNNSCRSRCCPMCQEFPKEKWIDAQKENVLDAPYYHVVFTVPEELNSIIYSNQKLLYDALYHAASATLNELSKDAKYLGADIGYICILHTWGSAMNYHPHIHTIVLGGGLDDENKWKDTGGNFFLPYGVISKVFRGKYLDELKSLWNDSKLKFHGTAEKYQNSYRFKELLDKCYEKNWVTYCKETFNGAQSVMDLAFGVLSVYEGKPERVLEIQKYVNEQYECCSNKKFMKVLETIARMNGNEEVYIEDMYACNKEARNYYLSELMMCFNFVFNEMCHGTGSAAGCDFNNEEE